jgi:predicted TPR repeat methyltransferase
VADALVRHLGAGAGSLDVLDAGCGTGLAAPFLSRYSRSLTGIDLSSPMLEKARERGGYDHLETAELTAYLDGKRDAFDLIVSIDTLCYFGDLAEVARGSAQALRPGGRLVFSVERHDLPEQPFHLHAHGRYAHARSYLESVLAEAGFRVEEIAEGVLRQEVGSPVRGWIVTALLPASR